MFKTMKDVPIEKLNQWEKEWEIWWKEFSSNLSEIDCMDYQDERQAFFSEKLGEYSEEGE